MPWSMTGCSSDYGGLPLGKRQYITEESSYKKCECGGFFRSLDPVSNKIQCDKCKKTIELTDSRSIYEKTAAEIGKLVAEKQEQYGNSHGNAVKLIDVLYPDGVGPDQLKDSLTIIRVIDKLFRIANGNQGNEDAWQDIVGYGLLAVVRNKIEKEKNQKYTPNPCSRPEYAWNTTMQASSAVPRSYTEQSEISRSLPNVDIDACSLAEFLNVDQDSAQFLLDSAQRDGEVQLNLGEEGHKPVTIVIRYEEKSE